MGQHDNVLNCTLVLGARSGQLRRICHHRVGHLLQQVAPGAPDEPNFLYDSKRRGINIYSLRFIQHLQVAYVPVFCSHVIPQYRSHHVVSRFDHPEDFDQYIFRLLPLYVGFIKRMLGSGPHPDDQVSIQKQGPPSPRLPGGLICDLRLNNDLVCLFGQLQTQVQLLHAKRG